MPLDTGSEACINSSILISLWTSTSPFRLGTVFLTSSTTSIGLENPRRKEMVQFLTAVGLLRREGSRNGFLQKRPIEEWDLLGAYCSSYCTHPGVSLFNDFAEDGREGSFFPDLGRAFGGFFAMFLCDCFGVEVTTGTGDECFSSGCSAKALSRSISSWAIGMYWKMYTSYKELVTQARSAIREVS